jgi:YaiO family outer membrane protein
MRILKFVAVVVAGAVLVGAAMYLVDQMESRPSTSGRSPGHPGVLALALASHCRSGEWGAARELILQITSPIRNAALRRAVTRCEEDFRFADAEADLRRGEAGRAIRLMSPWYPKGPDPYRAGVILLHADLLEHHLDRAIAMGRSLEARYPRDVSIAGLVRRLTIRARLDRARRALMTGHPKRAISLAAPVYQAGEDRYRAGEILAQAELAAHRLPAAKRIYASLAKTYPADVHLRKKAGQFRVGVRLAAARHALSASEPARALALAGPLYRRGEDPYGSGLVVARADLALGHPGRADAVYAALARQYPADRELGREASLLVIRKKLTRAREALASHEPARALALAGPLYRKGEDPYGSGLVVARADLALGHPGRADAVYAALARQYPADRELGREASLLAIRRKLTRAREALASHEPARALALAGPLYRKGEDPYGSGLVVARSDLALGHPGRAARVYATLARLYPQDPSLAVAAVVTHVQAGHPGKAQRELRGLNPTARTTVFNSLGSALTRLYGHFVTVDGGVAESTGAYPPDNQFGLRAGFPSSVGNFVVSAQRYHRFGETAEDLGLDYYTALGGGYAGELSVGYSPNNLFLADESFGAALSKSLGVVSIEGSVRHLIFSGVVANVLFAGAGFSPAPGLHVETGLYYVPETRAYSILVAPEWFHGGLNRTYLYLTAGEAGEELVVANSILRTPSYGVRLGEVFELSHHFSLNVALFLDHRSGLYDRRGVYLSLTRRW